MQNQSFSKMMLSGRAIAYWTAPLVSLVLWVLGRKGILPIPEFVPLGLVDTVLVHLGPYVVWVVTAVVMLLSNAKPDKIKSAAIVATLYVLFDFIFRVVRGLSVTDVAALFLLAPVAALWLLTLGIEAIPDGILQQRVWALINKRILGNERGVMYSASGSHGDNKPVPMEKMDTIFYEDMYHPNARFCIGVRTDTYIQEKAEKLIGTADSKVLVATKGKREYNDAALAAVKAIVGPEAVRGMREHGTEILEILEEAKKTGASQEEAERRLADYFVRLRAHYVALGEAKIVDDSDDDEGDTAAPTAAPAPGSASQPPAKASAPAIPPPPIRPAKPPVKKSLGALSASADDEPDPGEPPPRRPLDEDDED